jgi:hypothetical protein
VNILPESIPEYVETRPATGASRKARLTNRAGTGTFHSSAMSAYLTHIVSGIRNDIDFLVSQGALSQNDARVITDKLPATDASSVMPTSSIVPHRGTPNGPPMRNSVPPPPGPPSQFQAKALWAYNENGQVSTCMLLNK